MKGGYTLYMLYFVILRLFYTKNTISSSTNPFLFKERMNWAELNFTEKYNKVSTNEFYCKSGNLKIPISVSFSPCLKLLVVFMLQELVG